MGGDLHGGESGDGTWVEGVFVAAGPEGATRSRRIEVAWIGERISVMPRRDW